MTQYFPIMRADGTLAGMSTVETVTALLEKNLIEEKVNTSGIIYYVPTPAGLDALKEAIANG